jgi:hypothetical protein
MKTSEWSQNGYNQQKKAFQSRKAEALNLLKKLVPEVGIEPT